jgi:predicted AAA+ superfamily ATPase
LQLRRQYSDIYYYKTATNKEIDFVVVTPTGTLQLYQCCMELSSENTKKREISALIEAAAELDAKELFIITLDSEYEIQHNNVAVTVLPLWLWVIS